LDFKTGLDFYPGPFFMQKNRGWMTSIGWIFVLKQLQFFKEHFQVFKYGIG
jgi:hypothetical protein